VTVLQNAELNLAENIISHCIQICYLLSHLRTRIPAVAQKADRTAYDELINHQLHNKTLPLM